MRAGTLGVLSLVAASALVVCCGPSSDSPPPGPPVAPTAAGIASLFEAECLELRSFAWARARYEQERRDCMGEITSASIGDCRANVTGEGWDIKAEKVPAVFHILYFFDEVAEPDPKKMYCEISVPPELTPQGMAAMQQVAARHHFKGPFPPDGKLSTPLLIKYWTSRQDAPIVGVTTGTETAKGNGLLLSRY